jgi:Phytoene/squalene synthetase
MSSEIENAYKYCENVTRLHAKSFYFAARFLPKEKQPAIFAVYALCRHVDDEVDEAERDGESGIRAAIECWRSQLDEIYEAQNPDEDGNRKKINENQSSKIETQISNHKSQIPNSKKRSQIFLAWQDLLQKYKIPRRLPLELMKGVLMDTRIRRYESFEELYVYCYRVASTVGLMSSEIFGYEREEALDYAEWLGVAMQLTNILRDVRRDALMERIYLPQEDLRRFGVSESRIFEGAADENFIRLMKFEIARAREFYRKAEKGIPLLKKDVRFAVLLASRIYSQILDEIERQNYDVFARRAGTSLRQKLFSLPQVWREARKMRTETEANESKIKV